MTQFLQAIVNGIASGSIYAVLALSAALIFKTMGVVNFAGGAMGAVSAFILYLVGTHFGLGPALGVVLGLVGAAVLGALVEAGIVRPIGGGEAALFRLALATMGLDILINDLTLHSFGATVQPVGLNLSNRALNPGGVTIVVGQMVIVVVAVVGALLLALLLAKTNLGFGLRAYAQDTLAARLMGIPTRTVSRWTWILASVLGGLAAILVATQTFLLSGYLEPSFLQAMTAAVLGGLASLPGAVAGGFLLGIAEALSITYAPTGVTTMLPLIVLIVVLMIRPSGLFGRAVAQRT